MTAPYGDGPLRFATFLAPNMAPVYRFLPERMAERLGRPVDAAAYDDIRALLAVIEAAGWTSLTQRRSGVDARAVGEAVVTCRTGEQYGG